MFKRVLAPGSLKDYLSYFIPYKHAKSGFWFAHLLGANQANNVFTWEPINL